MNRVNGFSGVLNLFQDINNGSQEVNNSFECILKKRDK